MRMIGAIPLAVLSCALCAAAGAQNATNVAVDIEPQSMRTALLDLGAQMGLQVLFRAEDVSLNGKITPKVAGTLSAQEALDRLLASTALKYEFVNDHTVRISSTRSPAATSRAAAASPSRGAAATASAVDAGGLQEVVVTAQFREQTAQTTPLSVTAINVGTLEARSQTTVDQIAAQAPNVVLEPGPAVSGPALQAFIRGVGQSDYNFAFEPGVGIYVDDVYYSTLTGSLFDLLDLDRVEVLRGPQGTLSGMNSEGGAIKLFSKKPTGNGGGYVEATYGRFNRTDVRGAADFSVIPDRLFARIAGVARNQDGYVTRYDYACTHPGTPVASAASGGCILGTEGGRSYSAVRAAVRWTPTDRIEVNLSVDNTNDNSEASPTTLLYVGQANGTTGTTNTSYPRFSSAPTGGLPLGTATGSPFITHTWFGSYAQDTFSDSPYVTYATYCDPKPPSGAAGFCAPPVRRLNGYGFTGRVDYAVTDRLSLKSITSYRHYDADWTIDEDGSPLADEVLHQIVWHRQWTQELRLEGTLFDDAVNWTVGGFYLDQQSYYGGRLDLGSFEFFENDSIPARSKAGFLNVGWSITPKLEVNAGARYTEQDKTFKFGRLGVPGSTYPGGVAPQVAALNGTQAGFSGSKVDYRAAVQYQWTPALMTYGSVSTGFKGGGINPRPFYPAQAVPFKQETVVAYEFGLKSDWFDRRVRANLALFQNNYRDIQFLVNDCSFIAGIPLNQTVPCAATLNAGDADIRGIELELEGRLTSALSFDASVSYLDFEYTTLSPLARKAGITDSMTTPYAPRRKYSAGVQYEFDLGTLGKLVPRLDGSYQSSLYTFAQNSLYNRLPGYTLLNGRVTWSSLSDHWQAALQWTNITDELYYTGLFDNRQSSQTVTGAPGAPNQWALTVKYSF